MQFKWLIVLAISACLLLSVEAHEKKVNIWCVTNKVNDDVIVFVLQQRKITKKLKKTDEKQPVEQLDIQDAIDVLVDDEVALKDNLCAKKHCGAGKECRVNENGVAECLCMDHCPEEKDPRRMVH